VVMRRPWLEWSRHRFVWTGLGAWATLLIARSVLLPLTDSTALRSIIWVGFVAGGLMLFYVTFTWAKEYDRRNPRT
jgi:hypothetical protein